jgi:murein DD-endopeptidase MepM/ murein hydrolase activator NlpD
MDAQKFARQTLVQDRSYQVALANLGIRQKSAQMKVTAAEYKLNNGGFSPSQVQQFKGDAATIAQNALTGFTDTKGVVHPPLNVQGVMREMQQGIKHGSIPLSIAQDALKAAGWSIPSNMQIKAFNQTTGVGSLGGYVAPLQGATLGRVDQGQDFQGVPGSTVGAIGAGRVDAVKSDPNGFGKVVYYTILSGPAAGQQIYVGHAQPTVRPGQTLRPGQPVAKLLQKPLGNATQPGWTEIGFANGGRPTGDGQGFARFLKELGG